MILQMIARAFTATAIVTTMVLVAGCGAGTGVNAANPADGTLTPTHSKATPDKASKKPGKTPTATYVTPTYVVPTEEPPVELTDGVYEVGVDLKPGRYKTAGPTPDGFGCYYARLKNDSGDFEAIITNGNLSGRGSLTVKKTDGFLELSGGCMWLKA